MSLILRDRTEDEDLSNNMTSLIATNITRSEADMVDDNEPETIFDHPARIDPLYGIGGITLMQEHTQQLMDILTESQYTATATPGVFIESTVAYALLPSVALELIRISAVQIQEEILDAHFNDVKTVHVRERWLMRLEEYNWNFMTHEQVCIAVRNAVRPWALYITEVAEHLQLREEALPGVFGEFDDAFQELMTELTSRLNGGPENWLWPIYIFFQGVVKLTSDLEIYIQERKERVAEMKSWPSRHQVLKDMVENTPSEEDLLPYITNVLAPLLPGERLCFCGTSWDEALQSDKFAHRAGGTWCGVSRDAKRLLIKPGYEHVPVRFCAHVMCIGCIKTWLDQPNTRTCPLKDKKYGVHGSKAIRDVEAIGKTYGFEE